MMIYVQYYVYLSLGMAALLVVIEFFMNRDQFWGDGQINPVIDEEIDKGHIQKEVYGDRVVYYPKTHEGEMALKVSQMTDKLLSNKLIYLLIGYAMLVVMWPRDLYFLIRYGSAGD